MNPCASVLSSHAVKQMRRRQTLWLTDNKQQDKKKLKRQVVNVTLLHFLHNDTVAKPQDQTGQSKVL